MTNDNKKLMEDFLNANPEIDRAAAQKAVENKNADALLSKLSSQDKEKLNSILSDRDALKAALSSPQAQMLLKMFSGGGKNG